MKRSSVSEMVSTRHLAVGLAVTARPAGDGDGERRFSSAVNCDEALHGDLTAGQRSGGDAVRRLRRLADDPRDDALAAVSPTFSSPLYRSSEKTKRSPTPNLVSPRLSSASDTLLADQADRPAAVVVAVVTGAGDGHRGAGRDEHGGQDADHELPEHAAPSFVAVEDLEPI